MTTRIDTDGRHAMMQARMLGAVRARGADYYDRSVYGTVHEAAHGVLLGLDRWTRDDIDAALRVLPELSRMDEEVLAHAVSREVCRRCGVPLFPDSERHAAESTRAFALSKGEAITWTVDDFLAQDRGVGGAYRFQKAVTALMALIWEAGVAGL